jgi:hypothetical protein
MTSNLLLTVTALIAAGVAYVSRTAGTESSVPHRTGAV